MVACGNGDIAEPACCGIRKAAVLVLECAAIREQPSQRDRIAAARGDFAVAAAIQLGIRDFGRRPVVEGQAANVAGILTDNQLALFVRIAVSGYCHRTDGPACPVGQIQYAFFSGVQNGVL